VYIHRDKVKQCPVIAYSIDVSLFTYSAIKHDSDRQTESLKYNCVSVGLIEIHEMYTLISLN